MIAGVVLVVAGVVVAGVGALAMAEKLARNRWAGVRTKATMRSDQAFRVGNRVAGPAVIAGGVSGLGCGLIALVSADGGRTVWMVIGAVAMVVFAVVGGWRGDRAARAGD